VPGYGALLLPMIALLCTFSYAQKSFYQRLRFMRVWWRRGALQMHQCVPPSPQHGHFYIQERKSMLQH